MAISFDKFLVGDARWGRLGSATGGAPSCPGRRMLHVEEERARSASCLQLSLPLFGVLPRFFAVLATDREGQRPQSLLRNLLAAVEAVAVGALLEANECVVDLVQRFRFHLNEGELQVFLDVGFGAFNRVEHLIELAAPGAFLAYAAHLTLHFSLNFTPTV